MRVALVHDWLTGMRGGEKVLHELAGLFPDADLYTLIHVPGSVSAQIEALRIHTSPLSRIPGVARHYRRLLPLFPWAIERLHPRGYDLVISSSHAVAKGIPNDGPHLCYCLTPMRYVWEQSDLYLGRGIRSRLAAPLLTHLRSWDRRTGSAENVTRFVGISTAVVERIQRCYGREADLIFPPVDTERIRPSEQPARGYFLLVGGFVPYKREELAIQAFAELGLPLVVAGDGPTRAALQRRAPDHVQFRGRVSDSELMQLYRDCRALIYPQLEDFGIIAVEAQAAGRPVIAFGQGGVLDTVIPIQSAAQRAPTGIFFDRPSAASLVGAVEQFLRVEKEFESKAIRANAERFSSQRFRDQIELAARALSGTRPAA
jgi:glycosyltransferase involved in cell wall biosynthesis